MPHRMQNLVARAATTAKETFSLKGVILTAIITMMTSGTVHFIGEHALAKEQVYWEKYRQGEEAKSRWWDDYFKAVTSCR